MAFGTDLRRLVILTPRLAAWMESGTQASAASGGSATASSAMAADLGAGAASASSGTVATRQDAALASRLGGIRRLIAVLPVAGIAAALLAFLRRRRS